MTFFPRELGGTDSGDGNNNKETDNDEDDKSIADESELEDANLDRLTDEISLVVGDGSSVAYAAGYITVAAEEDAVAEESSEAENVEDFGKMNSL